MHIEIFSDKQLELLPFVKSLQRKFYLAGGTAIALHIGHRRSLDFDLFSRAPLNKHRIKNQLAGLPFNKILLSDDIDQIHFMLNNVKITFINFAYPIQHPVKILQFISMPSLLTLASMKAFAIGRRAKWKDYVDLYFILRDHFSIEEICNEATRNFGQLFSERLFRQQLTFHEDIDYSEPVEFLIGAPPDKAIKMFLIDTALIKL
ncbi:MAG: nucleotidyl transferase AbiEii/AbiGii toxin family protein [Bacteroidales bacterium]|nr:nucleotidyl transferase AbiEii/AbiGii toxin family protein [Bacteroidales bacterium]